MAGKKIAEEIFYVARNNLLRFKTYVQCPLCSARFGNVSIFEHACRTPTCTNQCRNINFSFEKFFYYRNKQNGTTSTRRDSNQNSTS